MAMDRFYIFPNATHSKYALLAIVARLGILAQAWRLACQASVIEEDKLEVNLAIGIWLFIRA